MPVYEELPSVLFSRSARLQVKPMSGCCRAYIDQIMDHLLNLDSEVLFDGWLPAMNHFDQRLARRLWCRLFLLCGNERGRKHNQQDKTGAYSHGGNLRLLFSLILFGELCNQGLVMRRGSFSSLIRRLRAL